MSCVDARPLLHAYLDGELDLSASLGIEQHLESCQECSREYRKLELLRAEIAGADSDFVSDAALRRIRASIGRRTGFEDRKAEKPGWRITWRTPAFLGATAAALALVLFVPGRFATGGDITDREIVDSHLRSLVGDHLIDVPSSDRHTVKPWFQGKVEFAPPVPDLTAEGFVLAGGRLDVIDTRKVAALIYKRREHVINLWISQGSAPRSEPELHDVNGYHVMRWTGGGMTYRAVSDLDPGELRTFASLVRAN